MGENEAQKVENKNNKLESAKNLICFMFFQWICDFPFIIFFILCAAIMPWRFAKICGIIYRYDIDKPLSQQLSHGRMELWIQFCRGILDYILMIEIIFIIITLIRIPFMIEIIRKNMSKSNPHAHKGGKIDENIEKMLHKKDDNKSVILIEEVKNPIEQLGPRKSIHQLEETKFQVEKITNLFGDDLLVASERHFNVILYYLLFII